MISFSLNYWRYIVLQKQNATPLSQGLNISPLFFDTSKFLWLHYVYQVFWETHFPLLHQQERHKLLVKGEGCSPKTLKSITFEMHLSARQQNKWEHKTGKYNSLKLLELKLSGRCCPTMAERSNWGCSPPTDVWERVQFLNLSAEISLLLATTTAQYFQIGLWVIYYIHKRFNNAWKMLANLPTTLYPLPTLLFSFSKLSANTTRSQPRLHSNMAPCDSPGQGLG